MNIKATLRSRLSAYTFTPILTLWICAGPMRVPGQVASAPSRAFWGTDGPVYAILVTNQAVYLGGAFSYVGPNTGGAGVIDLQSGEVQKHFPAVEGSISAAVSDGSGGWFIGGNFTAIGRSTQVNLAHVRADGTVHDTWRPNPNNTVNALALHNGVLYVGGAFTQIGGQGRNRLAALDPASGQPTGWNPNSGGVVLAIAPVGDTIYLAGAFSQIGGQARGRVAAVSAATGQVQPWNPNALQGQVNALVVEGAIAYVGGTFTTIGGKPRNRIAAFDVNSNQALDWNPNSNNTVDTLAVDGDVVYAGGTFTSIGSQLRNRVAALAVDTGLAAAWDPNASGEVKALVVANNTVFVTGQFSQIGGSPRFLIAALDSATGAALPWNPLASGLAANDTSSGLAVESSGNQIFVGGTFTSIGGFVRNNAASLNAATGEATIWNPDTSGVVSALAYAPTGIYLGGTFTNVAGTDRARLAQVASDTGALLPWNPKVFGRANTTVGIAAIAPSASRIYVGGVFTNIGGLFRTNIAGLNPDSGDATTWNPNTAGGQTQSQGVYSLLLAGDVLYVGGEFATIAGQSRNRLAAVSTQTAQAADWNPNANNIVSSLALKENALYVGGAFTQIGGQVRNRIAALDTATGLATSWNPDAGSTANLRVYAVGAFGNLIYAGGQFTTFGGDFRNRLASVTASSAQARSWNPNLDNIVRVLAVTAEAVFAGGDFTTVSGDTRRYFAAFSNEPEFDASALQIVNDEFQVPVRTGEGQRVVLQVSTDLKQWQELSNTTPGAPTNLKDAGVRQQERRFYRAVLETAP